jgi:phosphoserine phosphatase
VSLATADQAASLLVEFQESRTQLLGAFPGARLLAFWDLDGTLLAGDCSEGYTVDGRPVYPGLVQLGIEQGHSLDYQGVRGFERCMADYAWLKERVGPWMAFPFLGQVFAGADEQALSRLAASHFADTLARFYLPASRRIFDGLAAAGIEQHILSASAEIFVRGAAGSLGLPIEQLHGIRLHAPGGRLTRELVYPVTYAEGKLARLHQIIHRARAEDLSRSVLAVGAFGDNFANDGAFMAHVARQAWAAGAPIAVMINAGMVPAEYGGLFRSARHGREETVA